MAEYVYALHDFSPEHEDELTFKAGDKIEVVEKDEIYGDGWWQGRIDDGPTGLFPQAYTSPNPPHHLHPVPEIRMANTTLDSLPEESDESVASPAAEAPLMAATMTDIQHAIDQLAVTRTNGDNTSHRTFSFTSGTDTDRESVEGGEDGQIDSEGWRNASRQLLAENAQKANLKAAKVEQEPKERIAPPIPVEMSDESDVGEDDAFSPVNSPPTTARGVTFPAGEDSQLSNVKRLSEVPSVYSPALRTSELEEHVQEVATQEGVVKVAPPTPVRSPDRLAQTRELPETDNAHNTENSLQTSLDSPTTPTPPGAFGGIVQEAPVNAEVTPEQPHLVAAVVEHPSVVESPVIQTAGHIPQAILPVEQPNADIEKPFPAASVVAAALVQPLPQSAPITPPITSFVAPSYPEQQMSTSSTSPTFYSPFSASMPVPSSTVASTFYSAASPQSQPMSKAPSVQSSLDAPGSQRNSPSDWTVEQVVEWLRAKHFDEAVCGKFVEHEITGDVLLELDVNLLKELEIPAFGKRMRIANAINQLKRPASISSEPANSAPPNISGFTPSPTYPNHFGGQMGNSYNSGHPMNGMSGAFNPEHAYQQTSPVSGVGPFGLNYPYGSAIHGRNPSMSSSNPSGPGDFAYDGASMAMTMSSIGQEQTGARTMLQTAPVQLMRMPEEPKEDPQIDRVRSGSDPGAFMTASVTVPPVLSSTTVAPIVTAVDDEPIQPILRKGSLRSKPPLVTLSPNGSLVNRPSPWATATQSQTTLATPPATGIIEEDDKSFETEPATGSDPMQERNAMSDGEATGVKDIKRRMSTRKAVRASASSNVTAGSEAKSDDRASTPVSSIPPSPSFRGSGFLGSSTRRKRLSDDATATGSASGRKSDHRLSFFGGTLGKSRKPPPSEFSDTSPTVSSKADTQRSLSRFHVGSQRKVRQVPAPPEPQRSVTATTATKAVPPERPSHSHQRSSSDPALLRKRTTPGSPVPNTSKALPSTGKSLGPASEIAPKPGMTAIDQIGTPDHAGWMRKRGENFNSWKLRYLILKGPHLYYVKALTETKIKGYINIVGYKVVADENVHPGRYGFRIVHDTEKSHYFSSMEQHVVREWMKALMKATIGRDYSRAVVSSCNIPTIPLAVAQAMNPAPRPPSPTARDATQRAMRRENTNQLSSRDALVLMGMAGEPDSTDKARLDQFFKEQTPSSLYPPIGSEGPEAPPRPSREMRRAPSLMTSAASRDSENTASDMELINWINDNLPPEAPPATDLSTSLASGLILYRVAENIKGLPTDLPDSAFPQEGDTERLEGLFKLFDYMLDNDVRIGSVSINDVRLGNKEKITQLVKSLRSWQERRQMIVKGMSKTPATAGPWLAVG